MVVSAKSLARPQVFVLFALGALVLVAGVVAATAFSQNDEARSTNGTLSERASRPEALNDPVGDYPPAEWEVSLNTASQKAPYRLLFPDDPSASHENMKAVYQVPNEPAAVSYKFSSEAPERPLRFEGIWVVQLPWHGGEPLNDFKDDLALDPSPAKFLCEARGVPALCVNAHSPDDATGENAAFVRFVVDDIEVQVTGGESVEELIRIADTLKRL